MRCSIACGIHDDVLNWHRPLLRPFLCSISSVVALVSDLYRVCNRNRCETIYRMSLAINCPNDDHQHLKRNFSRVVTLLVLQRYFPYQANMWSHNNRHSCECTCPLYRMIYRTVPFCMDDVSGRNFECFPRQQELQLLLSIQCTAWNRVLNLWLGRDMASIWDRDFRDVKVCPSALSFVGLAVKIR